MFSLEDSSEFGRERFKPVPYRSSEFRIHSSESFSNLLQRFDQSALYLTFPEHPDDFAKNLSFS